MFYHHAYCPFPNLRGISIRFAHTPILSRVGVSGKPGAVQIWLGIDDPLISVMNSMNNDPDRESLRHALSAWQDMFGSTPTTINQPCVEPFEDDRGI